MKTSLALIAAAGLAVVAAPVAAANQSVTVEYKDLNLSSPKGQKILERRIDAAARQVCGADSTVTGTRIVSRESRACMANAKRQLAKKIASLVEDQRLGG